MPSMTFPALDALAGGGFAHRFTLRHPEIDVNEERAVVVERLWTWHRQQAADDQDGGGRKKRWACGQVLHHHAVKHPVFAVAGLQHPAHALAVGQAQH